jgi:hypothetical protein
MYLPRKIERNKMTFPIRKRKKHIFFGKSLISKNAKKHLVFENGLIELFVVLWLPAQGTSDLLCYQGWLIDCKVYKLSKSITRHVIIATLH